MIYVLGVVSLMLAAAVVVLFAMLGELASRVGTGSGGDPVRMLDVPAGAAPATWPAELNGFADADLAMALVLSTACSSCTRVAGELKERPELASGREIAVVVSTGDRERGDEFVRRHGLTHLPTYIDEGGDWVLGEFGVNTSPSALVFRRGTLVTAMVFSDVAAIQAVVFSEKERV